jgi:hypothetical protein
MKKSPAVGRGKTDSLEISQRGKASIYAKFTARCKRKKHKKQRLIEWNICNIVVAQQGPAAKSKLMRHKFRVLVH